MYHFKLVETSLGTYAMGGRTFDAGELYTGEYRSEVLKLECPGDQIQSCQWQKMSEKLEVGRYAHVAISLPDTYDICN